MTSYIRFLSNVPSNKAEASNVLLEDTVVVRRLTYSSFTDFLPIHPGRRTVNWQFISSSLNDLTVTANFLECHYYTVIAQDRVLRIYETDTQCSKEGRSVLSVINNAADSRETPIKIDVYLDGNKIFCNVPYPEMSKARRIESTSYQLTVKKSNNGSCSRPLVGPVKFEAYENYVYSAVLTGDEMSGYSLIIMKSFCSNLQVVEKKNPCSMQCNARDNLRDNEVIGEQVQQNFLNEESVESVAMSRNGNQVYNAPRSGLNVRNNNRGQLDDVPRSRVNVRNINDTPGETCGQRCVANAVNPRTGTCCIGGMLMGNSCPGSRKVQEFLHDRGDCCPSGCNCRDRRDGHQNGRQGGNDLFRNDCIRGCYNTSGCGQICGDVGCIRGLTCVGGLDCYPGRIY